MIFKTDDMKIKLRNIIFLLAICSAVVLNQSCGTPSNIPQTETVTQIYGSSFGNAPQVFSRYLPSDGIAEGTKIVFQTSTPERGLKVMNYHFESLFGAPQDISVIELDASRYEFKVADQLITNFHLPKSSLLMLVSAFCGRKRILDAYREAVSAGYRFFSYGDAMLIR